VSIASTLGSLKKPIIASIIIGIILFLALVSYAPDAVPFSTNNYGWNGLEQIAAQYSIHPIDSISNATLLHRGTGAVLLVIAPVSNFTVAEAGYALSFVKSGGTLIVADSSGFSNTLLGAMGVAIGIQSAYALYDSLYNWKAASLPEAIILPSAVSTFSSDLSGVRTIALNQPSPVSVAGPSVAVAATTSYSFESVKPAVQLLNANPVSVGSGPFNVAAIEKIGYGRVFVIGDSEFFTNQLVGVANNNVLISNLLSNSTVYLDTSHWPSNTSASLKAELASAYSIISKSGLRYLFTLAIVGAAIGLSEIFTLQRNEKKVEEKAKLEYDQKILEKIRKDRQRAGKTP
jgi:hypothetical protein